VLEAHTISQLLDLGALVVCGGGGGAPVIRDGTSLQGVEAVVDKDLTAALIAIDTNANELVMLTDVDGVKRDYGTASESTITQVGVNELSRLTFTAGSMGPKVEAGIRFVRRTGFPAMIGALGDAAEVLAGKAGTTIQPSSTQAQSA
jgi:carbamate kinase